MTPTLVSSIVLDEATAQRLGSLSGVVVCVLPKQKSDWEMPEELLRGPRILLCKHPPRNIDRMPDLQFMQITTVGYEHLRDRGFADSPVRVCNARGIFDTAIGEWCLAMMIDLARDLPGMMRNQANVHWERSERFEQEIRGRVVGLWGYGGIGRETARLAKAFGMTVHVFTRSGVRSRLENYTQSGTGDPLGQLPDRVFTAGEERTFLSRLDFLVLALPHTQKSRGLVGANELQTLPRSAFLLNPARGLIVQEQALLQALRDGWIAGAALDTHFAYPLPSEHPLWRFPNVILTPHISGADKSRLFPGRMADLFVQNVQRFVEGRPLLNAISAEEWREA